MRLRREIPTIKRSGGVIVIETSLGKGWGTWREEKCPWVREAFECAAERSGKLRDMSVSYLEAGI
jgi:hypothetical protein